MRVTPCPSPTGRNNERLFLVKLPRSTPAGALDAVLKRATDRKKYGRDEDPDDRLVKLRGKLEEFLERALPGDQYQSAMDLLTDCGLPESKMYGDADPDDADEFRPKYPDHIADGMRKYLADQGYSDDDIEAVMPRSAMEGGMGGEAGDRRGARDRRHAMDSMSAEARFEAMFGASRIKSATTFR
jgi:hypothetical protein